MFELIISYALIANDPAWEDRTLPGRFQTKRACLEHFISRYDPLITAGSCVRNERTSVFARPVSGTTGGVHKLNGHDDNQCSIRGTQVVCDGDNPKIEYAFLLETFPTSEPHISEMTEIARFKYISQCLDAQTHILTINEGRAFRAPATACMTRTRH